jgi:YHS domain-containing protein
MTEMPATANDPVCGMTVEPARAISQGLTAEHDGKTYYFCAKGCMLDFRDDPDKYLDPAYEPPMEM